MSIKCTLISRKTISLRSFGYFRVEPNLKFQFHQFKAYDSTCARDKADKAVISHIGCLSAVHPHKIARYGEPDETVGDKISASKKLKT